LAGGNGYTFVIGKTLVRLGRNRKGLFMLSRILSNQLKIITAGHTLKNALREDPMLITSMGFKRITCKE
jgi:hypothetical protein